MKQRIWHILFWTHLVGGFFLTREHVVGAASDDLCVDVGNTEFTCTDDVMGTRKRVDGKMIDVGITQRVDGSESEKKAIREVLRRMDEYFFNEVLSMPEYENVRPQWYVTNVRLPFHGIVFLIVRAPLLHTYIHTCIPTAKTQMSSVPSGARSGNVNRIGCSC
jgi:hypothetical protein